MILVVIEKWLRLIRKGRDGDKNKVDEYDEFQVYEEIKTKVWC